jgi:MATE family multidrug resistance protein
MAVMVCVPLLVFRGQIGYLFSDDAKVAEMVAMLVIPFVVYQFGDGLQCNYSNALRGIADVKKVSYYAFIAYFLVSLPSAYIFGFVFDWGLTGIWFSFPLGLTTAGLLFYSRFRRSICRP